MSGEEAQPGREGEASQEDERLSEDRERFREAIRKKGDALTDEDIEVTVRVRLMPGSQIVTTLQSREARGSHGNSDPCDPLYIWDGDAPSHGGDKEILQLLPLNDC
jgi:hypothetical protein